MRFSLRPTTLLAILATWAAFCVAAVLVPTAPLIFEISYYVLWFSAFPIPLLIGSLATHCAKAENPSSAAVKLSKQVRPKSVLISLAAAVVGVFGYLLCFAVLSRLLEIPWRAAKFGESTLDLGVSAAQTFTVCASVVFVMALALFRNVPRNSQAANYAAAAMGMIAFASVLYLAFGLSPLVEWRE